MGCDGGTIPKRDELVRTKKKKEVKDKKSELWFRWRCCSISQQPLQKPIVACSLGRLYSKDSVINGLLDRSLLPDSAKHIKSLKDVKELNLTANPAFCPTENEKGDSYSDHQSAPYVCPVIGLEMNGKFNFCFSWQCGCVTSQRALKELKSETCHKCGKEVSEVDFVVLNAAGNDLDLMMVRMEARQARAKAERKAKKAREAVVKEEPIDNEYETKSQPSGSKVESNDVKPKSTIFKPFSGGLKRGESLGMQAPDLKKAKSDYSVAKDPQASDVYKSIFTSSSKAQKQDRAHWVTYNPFYN